MTFKVDFWEFERGWGSKVDHTKEYDTKEEAVKAINDFNAGNTEEEVPDWYMVAKPNNFEL
jgi:hypothetical protein